MKKDNRYRLFPLVTIVLFVLIAGCGRQQSSGNLGSKAVRENASAGGDILGTWVRTDGGYTLEIEAFFTDSTLLASYFNPNPVNIAETEWKIRNGFVYFYIKFEDEGYPGSYYSLGYYPEKDILAGFYYQAVMKQEFDVVFVRK